MDMEPQHLNYFITINPSEKVSVKQLQLPRLEAFFAAGDKCIQTAFRVLTRHEK